MPRPRILSGRRHRCEPDLPIDTRLIRRDERRSAIGIAGLGFELVLLPFRIAADCRVVRSLKNNFVAFAHDGSKSPVGVYEIERTIRVIHESTAGEEIQYRHSAQIKYQNP